MNKHNDNENFKTFIKKALVPIGIIWCFLSIGLLVASIILFSYVLKPEKNS